MQDYYRQIEGMRNGIIERVVPHSAAHETYLFHLTRYKFAASFLKNTTLLDIGCGSGYGSFILAQHAAQVVSVDNSPEAIDFAAEHFYRSNLIFQSMDWKDLLHLNKVFDGIVALEFLEHIDQHERFLKIVSDLLTGGGIFIVSTPNKNLSTGNNPFHLKELDLYELKGLLSMYFTKFTIYGQFLKPEYLDRKEHTKKLRRRLDRLSRYAIHNIMLKFIQLFKKGQGLNSTPAPMPLEDQISISAEDILFTSSEKDIHNANYLLAVCIK